MPNTRRKKPALPAPVFFDEEIGLEHDVALSLIESDSLANALKLLLRRVCETVGWDYAQAWLPSPSNRILRVNSVWRGDWQQADGDTQNFGSLHEHAEMVEIKRGQGLVGTAWSTREAQWQTKSHNLGWAKASIINEYSIGASLAVPVVFNKRVAVVLEFLSHKERAEDKRMMNFVSALASRLSTIIEREYNDEALRRSEEWLRAAAEGSAAGFSILHFVRNRRGVIRDLKFVFTNTRAVQLLSLPQKELIGHHLFDLFPQLSARRFFQQCIRVAETGEALDEEAHFLNTPQGEMWVRYQIVAVRDGVAITAQDISDRKRSEQALRESEDRFRALIENATDIITIIGADGIIHYESPSVKHILGWNPEELEGKQVLDFIHPEDAPRVLGRMKNVQSRPSTGEPLRFRFRCRDNSWKHLESLGKNLLNEPSIRGILINSRDVSEQVAHEEQIRAQGRELERANRRLQDLATRDGLTHLKNQRAFHEAIEHEWQMAQRYGWPLSLAVLDVDHFKNYNDAFGHQAGDRVLVRMARLMESLSRKTDFVARYGGEEFTILMPNTNGKGAFQHVEEVRLAVEKAHWPHIAVTASVGVATWIPTTQSSDITSSDTLFACADQALYVSKNNGRNRTTQSNCDTSASCSFDKTKSETP